MHGKVPDCCILGRLMAFISASKGAGLPRRVAPLAVLGAAVCCAVLPAASFAFSAPSIGPTSAEVGQNEATLKAPIRPDGLETEYEIWLQCTSLSCTSHEGQQVADGSIQASRLEQEVSIALTSLEWEASYRFEVIASNADGTVRSYPQTFTTGLAPPPGCPDGCRVEQPVESKQEPWGLEGAERVGDEAPRLEEEREAKAKEEAERPAKEAAERAAKEREVREAGERAGREAAELEAKVSAAPSCVVPRLKGDSLAAARSALGRAHCKLGKVSKPRGHHMRLVVTGQGAKDGKKLASGAAVAVRLGLARG
jgi:hypothetical protein